MNEGFCRDCKFFDSSFLSEDEGLCRRFPPIPLLGAGTEYPVVLLVDWCGEFLSEVVEGPTD